MKLFGPLLWYVSEHLRVHYDYDEEVSTYNGTKLEEIKSRPYAYEVFTEPLADGILVSKTLVLAFCHIVQKDGRYAIRRHDDHFFDIRDFARLPEHYYSFADPGTWSYVHRLKLPDYLYDTDGMIDYYSDLNFDLAGSVDWPIIDKLRIKRKDKVRFIEATDDIKKHRVGITLELAQDFINKCNERDVNFIPFGCAQGYDIKSYRESVRKICKMGYEYIAVGGMPAYSEKQVLELLPHIWDEIKKSGNRPGFHLYGRYPSPPAVKDFLKYGVTSLDNNSNFLTAIRSPCPYMAPEFASFASCPTNPCRGLYLPSDRSPVIVRLKRNGSPKYGALRRLCRRAFFLYAQYSKHGTESSKKDFLKVYKHLVYSLNECYSNPRSKQKVNDIYQQAVSVVEEKPWELCGCTGCKRLKGHIVATRGPRNRWMSAHNLYIMYTRLIKEMKKSRNAGCEEPFYDYEGLSEFLADKLRRKNDDGD
jgi:hypothetical protein